VCLKRKALYRRVESYREGTVAMLKLERRRLAHQSASQPSSQAVAELESEAILRQSVRRPPMASISNSAKEEGRQQWLRQQWLLLAMAAAAAALEKGPYFFSLAASACLVGRSPFTVLWKVWKFLWLVYSKIYVPHCFCTFSRAFRQVTCLGIKTTFSSFHDLHFWSLDLLATIQGITSSSYKLSLYHLLKF
jgi:hypothetical protein